MRLGHRFLHTLAKSVDRVLLPIHVPPQLVHQSLERYDSVPDGRLQVHDGVLPPLKPLKGLGVGGVNVDALGSDFVGRVAETVDAQHGVLDGGVHYVLFSVLRTLKKVWENFAK